MKSITIIAAVAVLATIMTTGAVYAHTPNIDWKVNYDTILAQYQELWNQHQVISGLYNNTQAQIDRLDRILNDTRTNLDSAHDRINAQSADILIYKNQITNLQSSSDHWKAEALQKEDTVKKLKGDKKNLKNTIADLEDQVEKLKDRIKNKKQNAQADSQGMEALKAEMDTMKRQMEEMDVMKDFIETNHKNSYEQYKYWLSPEGVEKQRQIDAFNDWKDQNGFTAHKYKHSQGQDGTGYGYGYEGNICTFVDTPQKLVDPLGTSYLICIYSDRDGSPFPNNIINDTIWLRTDIDKPHTNFGFSEGWMDWDHHVSDVLLYVQNTSSTAFIVKDQHGDIIEPITRAQYNSHGYFNGDLESYLLEGGIYSWHLRDYPTLNGTLTVLEYPPSP